MPDNSRISKIMQIGLEATQGVPYSRSRSRKSEPTQLELEAKATAPANAPIPNLAAYDELVGWMIGKTTIRTKSYDLGDGVFTHVWRPAVTMPPELEAVDIDYALDVNNGMASLTAKITGLEAAAIKAKEYIEQKMAESGLSVEANKLPLDTEQK